jgi:hemerythrin superfamily protein
MLTIFKEGVHTFMRFMLEHDGIAESIIYADFLN